MDSYLTLQPQLRADEQLLWHGVPDPRVRFAPGDAFLVPFSIMWCAFAVFWEASAVAAGAGGFFAVFGIPFVALGAYFVAGRFAYKRYRKGRTAYGITSQRALIAEFRTFADMPLRQQPVTVRRARDGRHASITFGSPAAEGSGVPFRRAAGSYYANTGMEPLARSVTMPFAFYDVADPDAMLAALEQARAQPAA